MCFFEFDSMDTQILDFEIRCSNLLDLYFLFLILNRILAKLHWRVEYQYLQKYWYHIFSGQVLIFLTKEILRLEIILL
jgi:hypothetical protein